MEYLEKLVEECGTDYRNEPADKPRSVRPPDGAAAAPDGESVEKERKHSNSVEDLMAEAVPIHRVMLASFI